MRMGGQKAWVTGTLLGFAVYIQAARWPLYTERAPYRLILATLGYGLGVNLASRLYGDKNHYVYYTRREYDFLIDQLGPSYVKHIKLIPGEEIT